MSIVLWVVGVVYGVSLLVGIPWMLYEMRHATLENPDIDLRVGAAGYARGDVSGGQ